MRHLTAGPENTRSRVAADVGPLAFAQAPRYIGTGAVPAVAVISAQDTKIQRFRLGQVMTHREAWPGTVAHTRIWEHAAGDVCTLASGCGGPSLDRIILAAVLSGVRVIVRVGTCGLLAAGARVGDVVVAGSATGDDSVFAFYRDRLVGDGRQAGTDRFVGADARLLADPSVRALAVPVFSTSLMFHEGPAKVAEYEQLGCAAADMETAALYGAGAWYRIPVISILIGADHIVEGGLHTIQAESFQAGVDRMHPLLDGLLHTAHFLASQPSAR